MMRLFLLPLALLVASPAWAEVELSFYGGWQGAPDGGVTISGDAAVPDTDVSRGDVLEDSPQYGVRATWWGDSGFGIALDYSHLGTEADAGTLATEGLDYEGLATLTVNGMRRWEDAFGGVTPYVGAGLGVAMADVEVAGGEDVQATGPAVSWVAGASVPLSGNWSVFGEYEGTYARTEGDLDGGGSLEAEGVTNSINLGVSFSF